MLFVFAAVAAPLIAPYSATETIPVDTVDPPSTVHLFGTDHLGRDIFSRVLYGTRSVLSLAGLGTLLAVLLGLTFGLFSGYRGGWFDEILMRFFDSLLAIPAMLLALLLLGTIGPSRQSVLIVIVIVFSPIVARVVRSETLAVKSLGFVEAARLQGESTFHILYREILPSVLPALSVEAALRFSYAIFLVASLGFLGVGVQPPTPDWGLMVSEARNYVGITPWALYFPAGSISLLVIGVNLLADGLKRALRSPAAASEERDESVRSRGRAQRRGTPRRSRQRAAEPRMREQSSGTLLSLENLSVSYTHEGALLDAVRDVSLSIEPGETYGLVGESGSGKTTLALALMRYLPPNGDVWGGDIRFAGRDLLGLSGAELRALWGKELSLVPQDPAASLNPSLRVGEQIAEILRRHEGLSPTAAASRVATLLEDVHVADAERVAHSYPHLLSGGMQQRVMIAMALSTAPRLLVMDEPTTGLDVTTEAAVLDLIDELIREREMAMLYITHDLGVVARIADHVAVLYAGELVEDAPTEALYESSLHPYTQGLLNSVPRLGESKRAVRLTSMRGRIPSLASLPAGCVYAPRCPLAIDRCHQERPPMDTAQSSQGGRRRVRCHRWREVAAGMIDAREASFSGRSSGDRDPGSTSPKPAEAGAQDGEPVLSVKDLKAHFRLRLPLMDLVRGRPARIVKAVDGVDLAIAEGRTLGLVGESGSGKTTLARAVLGLTDPVGGDLALNGEALPKRLSPRKLSMLRRLQMVAQNPEEALNPYTAVGEILRRPLLRFQEVDRRSADRAVAQLLEMVRLGPDYAPRLPAQLSGGEKQRVAIARAFAAHPALIISDEPTSALDVSVQARILNLLVDLQKERESAYLFISHDLSVVGYVADEIAVIYLGRLMETGRTKTFFEPPYHPYTEALLSAIPLLDPRARQEHIRLAGEIPSPTDVPPGCPFHTRCPRYLGDICAKREPPWQETADGRHIFCHIPIEQLEREQKPVFRFADGQDEDEGVS